VQKDVLFGLRQGTLVLQAIQREMGGLEGVEKLMEETEEARAYQEQVSQMLAGQMSNQDEDEVEDELEALEHELGGPVKLPDATTALFPENISERGQEAKAKERARARARAKVTTAAASSPVPLEA